jgi:hypothetical protein
VLDDETGERAKHARNVVSAVAETVCAQAVVFTLTAA